MVERREFEVVTFDCYGTLIDWESGIQTAFSQALEGSKLSKSQRSRAFQIYLEEEKKVEGEKPFRRYRDVLSLAASNVTSRLGIRSDLSTVLADSLPKWNPFPDTNPALERLARNHKLGILSNVDDDLLTSTLRHFTVPFDILVTAERVKSYKPGIRHFEEARRIIGPKTGWTHAAASFYHDIEPAFRLGVNVIWVNRTNEKTRTGYAGKIVEVKTLTELADRLEPKLRF